MSTMRVILRLGLSMACAIAAGQLAPLPGLGAAHAQVAQAVPRGKAELKKAPQKKAVTKKSTPKGGEKSQPPARTTFTAEDESTMTEEAPSRLRQFIQRFASQVIPSSSEDAVFAYQNPDENVEKPAETTPDKPKNKA